MCVGSNFDSVVLLKYNLGDGPLRGTPSKGSQRWNNSKVGDSPINLGPYSKKNQINHAKRTGYAGTNPPIQLGEILKCSDDNSKYLDLAQFFRCVTARN